MARRRLAHSVAVTASRRRRPLIALVAVAVVGAGVFVAGKADGLRRLGTPLRQVTTDAPPPAPLGGTNGFAVKADGRLTDLAVLPGRGEVVYVEEVAHRVWQATAVDAHTGAVRWSVRRGDTAHIEAWAVTDAAVVLAFHNSASRLAWRTHHAADFEGLDPVTGKVLWTRHVYNLLGERPGDYDPALASPSADVVYARTEFGVPNAVDTRTGKTLWEHPELHDCTTDEIAAGPAGVAISQRCPRGKERLDLLDPLTGKAKWTDQFSTPKLRLLAVGTDSVAVYQGGMVQQAIVLGPAGGYAATIPCDCGDGAGLTAGAAGPTVIVGGPFGLVGADGATGTMLWQQAVAGGPVHRVLAQDGDAYAIGGDGALLHVDPGTGATRVVVPGGPGPLDPGAVVAAVDGYIAAGGAQGFGFSGPPR
ncbi:MAG TPA: PQQ-binding-like beta-propeller repeat protein [Acidimicrobiia bacterium]|nr:PQQ-binding-like beta-propeller repeat protein [Acidimicrobiia bacterium]